MSIVSTGPIIDYLPSSEDIDYRCGNNKFSDDIWDFKGYVDAPHWNAAKFQINFTALVKWDSIKITIKKYISSELLINGFNSVKRKHSAFKQLVDYLSVNPYIKSFKDFTDNTVRDFFEYVTTCKSEKGSPLSGVSKKKAAQVVKELLLRGVQRGWEVSEKTSKINRLYDELIINNKIIKEETAFGKTTNKVLPDKEIIDNLFRLCQTQIDKGKDVLTATSIILSSQLGLRISEVVLIKENCLSVIGGEYQITYTTSKTNKAPEKVFKPANQLVCDAIRVLEKHTKPLRKYSGIPYLFLVLEGGTNGEPMIASHSNWRKNRLDPFIKKHNLQDENGKLLKLTQHYFRHIFATYALKGGMKVHNVSEMMNHKSLAMTDIYDHTKGEKQGLIEDILTGNVPITSTNKIALESLEDKENPFQGLTTNQLDKLRRTMKIELLPHGVCLHHPMRGEPCEQDGVCLGCHEFLATASHLPVYKNRLDRVEQELKTLDNDKSIYTTKLRYQQGILQKYVEDLKRKQER